MEDCVICVYAKPPIPGRTKSRLARTIGDVPAAELAAALLQDTLVTASRLDAAVQLWQPPEAKIEDFDGLIPDDVACRVQHGADLGARMANTFDAVLREGASRALLLGSDCVTHSVESLSEAFAALDRCGLVFQSAVDGGYVLVGLSDMTRMPFAAEIPWGTDEVMARTRSLLQRERMEWIELEKTFDIDYAEDLQLLAEFVDGNQRAATEAWLVRYGSRFLPA